MKLTTKHLPIRKSKTYSIILLLTAFFSFTWGSIAFGKTRQDTSVVLKIAEGYIKGTLEDRTTVYKGIPYARPPIDQLRFLPPLAPKSWKDTLSCQTFGAVAAQSSGNEVVGDEDCLTLNVYAPSNPSPTKRPVLVWVHGGGMTAGAGKGANGHAFADTDSMVTVTINYRLGVFGFLYLGDQGERYETSGNNALLDCIMALKWIQKNIASFGGDPAQVTVIGESAGAKLSSTLLLAPQAKGLFHQLILESGSVQCVRDSVTAKAIRGRLLKVLGLSRVSDLLKLPTETLIKAQAQVLNGVQGTNYFGPVADGKIIDGDPYAYIKAHPPRGIRVLMGTNKDESRMFINADKRLNQPDTTCLTDWFGENFHHVLTSYKALSQNVGPKKAAKQTLTQYMYQLHSYRLAKVLAAVGTPVWMYRFDYSEHPDGATHADELRYVWLDSKQSDPFHIHQQWVAFIKGRQPNTEREWPVFQSSSYPVKIIDQQGRIEKNGIIFDDPHFPSSIFLLGHSEIY